MPGVAELRATVERLSSQLAAARRERSVLDDVLGNVPHNVFWKDRECRIRGCNANFARYMGRSVEEILGKNNHELGLPHEQAELFTAGDLEVMRAGVPLLDMEEPLALPDGSTAIVLTSKVPMRDEHGDVTGMLGIFVEITRMKRLEAELSRAKEQAESASHAKSEFLATMSHELRTPLALILGPLDSLLAGAAGPLGEDARRDLARVRRSAERLRSLVDDVLDHERLSAGRMPVRWEAVDVEELVSLAVEEAQPAAAARGLSLSFARSGSTSRLGEVPLDRGMFEKILLNLLSNALKFTPAGGEVRVELLALGGALELGVRDTGIGIPGEAQATLFERFQQVDGTSTRQYGGTGLGLALVKRFAGLMGGTVTLESEAGRGARFAVRIPTSADQLIMQSSAGEAEPSRRGASLEARLTSAAAMSAPAAAARRPRVLFAEDNADLRDYVSSLLAREHDVTAVGDGREALAAARAAPPDVIVTDVMMPIMDGLELVAELKGDAALRHIPVIVLTARAGRDAIASGLDHGADDYLAKPFSPAELSARVRAALRAHRMYQELHESHRKLQASFAMMEELLRAEGSALTGQLVQEAAPEIDRRFALARARVEELRPAAESIANGLREVAGAEPLRVAARRIAEGLQEGAGGVAAAAALLAGIIDGTATSSLRSAPQVDVNEILARILPARVLAADGHAREVERQASTPAVACVDPEDLRAAIEQVLGFLRGFPPDASGQARPPITVRLEAPGGQPRLEIADPALVLGPGELGALLRPDAGGEDRCGARSRRLGLAVAADALARNGGELAVEPAPGGGTRFCLRLAAVSGSRGT